MKQVIHIYGASGSGVSTLGRRICQETGFFFMDTDDYFWMPTDPKYTVKREKNERLRLMRRDIEAAEGAVISGALSGWGDELMPLFTLAVRLEADLDTRLSRLHEREYEKFGPRIEPGGDMYEQHLEFLEWARRYDTGGIDMRSSARHDRWQQLLQCPRIDLDGAGDLEENLRAVREALAQIQNR